jgi:hypothetical protein
MSLGNVIRLVLGATGVAAIIIAVPGCKPSTRQLIAEDNAKEADVLAAARSAARQLDGSDGVPTFDDVQSAVGSDFQVGGGGSRLAGDSGTGGLRSIYLFEITNADGTHPACLNVDATFENFEYTITASADPGPC